MKVRGIFRSVKKACEVAELYASQGLNNAVSLPNGHSSTNKQQQIRRGAVMKAITTERYGTFDDLQWQDVEKPEPKADEVLIKVRAASINPADRHALSGKLLVRLMFGLRKPKFPILGADVAGTVEAIGENITQFKVGDEVFGELSGSGFGGFAEYVCAPADVIVHKPDGLTFEEAAAVPMGALTALQGLSEAGGIKAGQKLLINGASGGVGTFAVQIGRALGAEVTGVCRSDKMEAVRAVGADHVIDYTQEDFTQNGVQYDLIFDTAAYRPISEYRKSLTPNGTYLLVGGALDKFVGMLIATIFLSMRGDQTFKSFTAKASAADLLTIKQMIEAEEITPVVDRHFALTDTAEAFRYQANGHATGKVIVVPN